MCYPVQSSTHVCGNNLWNTWNLRGIFLAARIYRRVIDSNFRLEVCNERGKKQRTFNTVSSAVHTLRHINAASMAHEKSLLINVTRSQLLPRCWQ